MGQALYRKYRSKSLDEIVGQEHITDTLKRAIKAGKLSHAYLFTGPKGVGKTSIARILAHEVNGLPYTDESIHLDIIEIDAASNRRIDEIRDLRDKVHIAPTSAKYKVYIIDEVHMLTKEAFNALLKTLEEPPAHVIFILATTEAHKLPDTIVSRTQRFTFKAIEEQSAIEHLRAIAKKEKMKIDDDALRLLAEHGRGSFRDAIGLLDQVGHSKDVIGRADVESLIGIAPAEAITGLLSATLSGDPKKIVACIDSFAEQGIAASQVAKQLGKLVRRQLLDGSFKGEKQTALRLLERILAVPSSSDPGATLELALFAAIEDSPQTVPIKPQPDSLAEPPRPQESTPKPTAQTPNKKDAPATTEDNTPVAAAEAIEEPAVAPTEPLGELEDISSWWPQLVDSIKKHNNTLYGVLRMAHPQFSGETLKLSFGFALHAKKTADASVTQKLREVVSQLTGRDVSVKVVHDISLKGTTPNLAVPTASPIAAATQATTENVPTPELSAITSIFGGAEVLES